MENKINELIEVSRYYGMNKEYVIAGGGNTSFKNKDYLWVKASGVSLADIQHDGFVCLSRNKLKLISEKKYGSNSNERETEVKNDLSEAIFSKKGKRPSVETSLHNIMNYPYVVHVHPTLVNSILCSKYAKQLSLKLFGNDVLFIEYTDPGYLLFKKVSEELNNFSIKKGFEPKIILLENHGIIVGGSGSEEIKNIYHNIENIILKSIKGDLPSCNYRPFRTSVENLIADKYFDKEKLHVNAISCDLIKQFIKDEESFTAISTAFTPDHVVYCKSRYLFVNDNNRKNVIEKLNKFIDKYGYLPKIIGIKNKGLLIIEKNQKFADIVRDLIVNMMKISFYARFFGGSKPMNVRHIDFIENWEAENYRRQIAEKS